MLGVGDTCLFYLPGHTNSSFGCVKIVDEIKKRFLVGSLAQDDPGDWVSIANVFPLHNEAEVTSAMNQPDAAAALKVIYSSVTLR